VVVCGALGQDALVAEALRVGARSFVLKPLHPERTPNTLRQVTEKSRQTSSLPEAAF
jgi:PleD family two-component response regulator